MKYTIDKEERYAVVTLLDENINSLVAPKLKSEFVLIRNSIGSKSLVVDLSNVKYIDSSGLSALLTGNRLWEDHGNYILTGYTNPTVAKLLTISKLDQVMTMLPSVEESIDYIMMTDLGKLLEEE